MMKRCAACNLPMTIATIGDAFSASSNDDTRHAVFAICKRCAAGKKRLPPATYRKTILRAADRALDDPERYLCKLVNDPGAARLALGLLAHPAHTMATIAALGWV
jgi:hypothetical protein